MSAVLQILLDIAPEMAAEDEDRVTRTIALAASRVGKCFGDARDLAIAYMVAHILTIGARAGAGGPITSETEGNLSRSYGATASKNALMSTSYGQEFERLRQERCLSWGNRVIYGAARR